MGFIRTSIYHVEDLEEAAFELKEESKSRTSKHLSELYTDSSTSSSAIMLWEIFDYIA